MGQPTETEPESDLPVEEVIAALEGYQRLTIDIFERHSDDPERCVKELIALHLRWTEEDPERAKLVARNRNAVMAGPGRDRLSAANADYFNATRTWLRSDAVAEQLPSLSFNVMHALVFAPSQELAKHWLGGRLRGLPTAYADRMGRAAWAGLLAAGGPQTAAPEGSQ